MLGSFFLRTSDTLLLDLRSCEAAILAIPFFDKHLRRKLIELEDAEVVNRLFPANDSTMKLSPDSLFDSQRGTRIDPKALMQQLVEKTAGVRDPDQKMKILLEDLESQTSSRFRRSNGFRSTTPKTALNRSSWRYGSGSWSPCSTGWGTPRTLCARDPVGCQIALIAFFIRRILAPSHVVEKS